jgi:hypothetical protein
VSGPSDLNEEATQNSLLESDAGNRGDFMKSIFLLAMFMTLALSVGAFAQSDNGGVKQDTKDAAHSTGQAAKKTGHKVKKGTKKAVNKSADATRKGSEKVEDKTDPK